MQRPSLDQLQIEEKLVELRKQYAAKENFQRRSIILIQSRALIIAWEKLMKQAYQKPIGNLIDS